MEYERYKVIKMNVVEEYDYKYPYQVLRFAGMRANGRAIYTMVKQTRSEKRAFEYIERMTKKDKLTA